MKTTIIKALSYLALVNSVTSATVEKTANYDDLSTSIIQTPVGTYQGLKYNAWSRASQGAVAVGGVKSQSPPNRIVTSSIEQITNGTPSFSVVSPYTSFSPLDFYFGCALRTAETIVTTATQCTVTVAGFVAKNNQEVAVASFTFTPPVSPVAPVPMQHAVLPASFHQKLVNVTMIETTPLTTAMLVDNLHYDLFVS